MDLNKVTMIGNLVRDPFKKELPSGQSLSFFRLATNHSWKDAKTKEKKDNVEFHQILAWGKLAEIITKYLKKGSRIYLEGRLRNRDFKDKDGKKNYRTDIIADSLIMLGKPQPKTKAPSELTPEEVNLTEIKVEE